MKTYNVKVNGNDYTVEINSVDEKLATVSVNGTAFNVELESPVLAPKVSVARPQTPIQSVPAVITSTVAAPRQSVGPATGMKSPLPGVILDIFVKEGETVTMGQKLMVLEAMKMENNIESEKAGVISKIAVSKGSSVMEGDLLIVIE